LGKNINNISGNISLSPLSVNGTFNPTAETFMFDTPGAQPLTATWTQFTARQQATLSRTVFPVAAATPFTLTIPVGAVTLADTPALPAISLAFPSTTLLGGKSYTLRFRLKRRVPGYNGIPSRKFAGSNIYWDNVNQRPTFKPHGYVGTENYYVGLRFKFGSLVGMSPRDVSDLQNLVIYVLYYNGGSNPEWVPSLLQKTNDAPANGAPSHPAWTAILDVPYTVALGTATSNEDSFAIDPAQNEVGYWNVWKGDICQYISATQSLGGDYRLPVMKEIAPTPVMGSGTTFTTGSHPWGTDSWIREDGNNPTWALQSGTNLEDDGTNADWTNCAILDVEGGISFPATGQRLHNTSATSSQYYTWYGYAQMGFYWSGSTHFTQSGTSSFTHGCFFLFYPGYFVLSAGDDDRYGYSVRCVLQEYEE
jgi:hypothetical protein